MQVFRVKTAKKVRVVIAKDKAEDNENIYF